MIRATQPAVIKRSYRPRFRPDARQQRALAQWFGHARFAWNWALATRSEHGESAR